MSISFDRIADRYDATRGFPPEVTREIGPALIGAAELGASGRVIEIGVGTGRIARPVVAAAPASLRYIGVDISRAMLARLRAQLPAESQIALLQADATRLPLANGSADVVIESHVLHLVSSVEAVLAEALRVLRGGGSFLSLYSHTLDNNPLAALGHGRWREVVGDLGGLDYLRNPRSQRDIIVTQLRAVFGPPAQEVVLASWQREDTPRAVLDNFAHRIWSSTWEMPEPLLQEAVRRLEEWARATYGDLDRPLASTTQFKLERYRRAA